MPVKTGSLNGSANDIQVNDVTGGRRAIVSTGIIPAGARIAGAITGSAAGAYLKGPDVYSPGGFMLRGHPSNTSYVTYGLSGTLGFPMGATDGVYLPVENLNQLYLKATVAGEMICWSMA